MILFAIFYSAITSNDMRNYSAAIMPHFRLPIGLPDNHFAAFRKYSQCFLLINIKEIVSKVQVNDFLFKKKIKIQVIEEST